MKLSETTCLKDWLSFLESRYGQEIQLRLQNARTVAQRLDLLDFPSPIITVGGTNGKGSTVTTLEAIYSAAGYRVGAYTSPHLLHFNERIRVNQQPIQDQDLCKAFSIIEQARGSTPLTYFEMATLAALLYFKQSNLEVILLEVGMGGRLDATNILNADLAIITTIDLDHEDYLGHDKNTIGYEKAGILRANKPFIYADYNPPVSVLEQASLLKVPMQCLGKTYSFCENNNQLQIQYRTESPIELPLPKINSKAATAAIIASNCLQNQLPVTKEHWTNAMQRVAIPGRQQLVKSSISTLFDVAHNPQAVSLLADFIRNYRPRGNVHAVFSGLKDKNLCGLIKPMQDYVDFWYPALLDGKRAADSTLLESVFQAEVGISITCFNNPVNAYSSAMEKAKTGDLIVVYGSFLTVGAVMANLEKKQEVIT